MLSIRSAGRHCHPERRAALPSESAGRRCPSESPERMFHGIDFSGGAALWRRRCRKPTVWIATVEDAASPRLADLRPVQDLPGGGEPFANLLALLRAGRYTAAAIDAPFAIPAPHLPPGGAPELLDRVGKLPPAADRPFPSGAALLDLARAAAPLDRKKPLRLTERFWASQGVNTRSTLWNGPRGGAPFAAACLTLLARAERPIWPWTAGPGMLVEAFPAAQLRSWGLPHAGYGAPEQREAREPILAALSTRLAFDATERRRMLDCPDALDAAIAVFAAIAAARDAPPADPPSDGFIAVMDGEADR